MNKAIVCSGCNREIKKKKNVYQDGDYDFCSKCRSTWKCAACGHESEEEDFLAAGQSSGHGGHYCPYPRCSSPEDVFVARSFALVEANTDRHRGKRVVEDDYYSE